MKLRTKELPKLSNSLEQLVQTEMLQRTAFFLGRIQNKIESEMKQFNKSRTVLEMKYGSYKAERNKEILTFREEDGKKRGDWYNEKGEKIEGFEPSPSEIYWKAKSDADFDKYMKELETLGEAEIEISLEPVKVSELVTGAGIPISVKPRIMADLEPIFIE